MNENLILIAEDDADVDAGLGAGADRYLPKPLSPRRLVAELRGLIDDRHHTAPFVR